MPTAKERRAALDAAGYNVFELPSQLVTIDLLTDSGVTAMSARQWSCLFRGDESYAGATSFQRLESVVQAITGYAHVIPTHQGRAAERLLFEAIVRPGDVVPGNMHFDTTRANIEAVGATAIDLPLACTRTPSVERPFKGNMDLNRLELQLQKEEHGRVPFVLMTVTSNGTGGQPVSLENLREVRKLCDRYDTKLFIDAARFAENAWLIHEREDKRGADTPREIARAMFDCGDGCLMSAKKDGLVNIGGFLAMHDGDLAGELKRTMVLGEGFPTYGGLAGRDLETMACGLEEVLEPVYLMDRIAQVRHLGDRLHEAGIPTVRPSGGHAIYIDSRAFAPHLDASDFPGQALVCALYLHAGVRAVEIGQLMLGRPDDNGYEIPVDLDLVRLAIPRRVYTCCHLDYVVEAIVAVHAARDALQPLEIVSQPKTLRHFGATLRPRESPNAGPKISVGPQRKDSHTG